MSYQSHDFWSWPPGGARSFFVGAVGSPKNKGSEKKFWKFFSNYVPPGVNFSRLSGIDCKKKIFKNRSKKWFKLLISIFVSIGQYMDQI